MSLTPDAFLPAYRAAAAEREGLGVPPLALDAEQTKALTELLENASRWGRADAAASTE